MVQEPSCNPSLRHNPKGFVLKAVAGLLMCLFGAVVAQQQHETATRACSADSACNSFMHLRS
jgi:hypothetical protein